MLFRNYLLVQYSYFTHHQQSHVCDDIVCQRFIVDIVSVDIQSEPLALQAAAEDVLADLRNCPPAPGFDRVEIPGEREREQRRRSNGIIAVPEETWRQVLELSEELKQG